MSPPKTASRDPAEYLASVLPLNPIFQAEEILAARDRFLGRASAAGESDRWQLQEQREALHAQINTIREQFWTLKAQEMREALDKLSVDRFPDLKLAVERLRAAFRVRSEFPKIAQHKQYDEDLFEMLKAVAVAAPRDAGRTKQAFFLRTSSNFKLHRRCAAMIKTLCKEFPKVFALEQDWLQQIEQTKPIAGKTESEKEADQRAGRSVGAGAGWLVACVLISLVGRAIMFSQKSSTSSPSRANPVSSPSIPTFKPTFSPQPTQPQQQSDTIKRLLEAQQPSRSSAAPLGSPQNPIVPPPTSSPNADDIRKRIESIRQQNQDRLDRLRPRIPNTNPPPGIPQPRGP